MNKLQTIFLAVIAVVCAFTFVGCGDNEPEEPKHTITLTQTDDYGLTANKTEGVFGDEIIINVELKNFDKKLTGVSYGSGMAGKKTDTSYSFVLTKNVTITAILEDYAEQLTSDTSSRPFAAFSSSNTKTIVPNTGDAELSIDLNGAYMTILNSTITSSNQSVIPNDAFTIEKITGSSSNLIYGATLIVDTTKIHNGSTWVTIALSNGNTSSQKGTLVVKMTVADSIPVTTWTETVVFDLRNIPTQYKNQDTNFYIAFYDYDYINGMDIDNYIYFENQKISNDNTISVTFTYAAEHKYSVSLGIHNEESPADSIWFTLNESVGSGTNVTGFNQYKNSYLSFINNNSTLTIYAYPASN